jgi:hypothetical protein
MAPTELEVADATKLLGEDRAGAVLGESVRAAMLKAFEQDLWTLKDVPSGGDVVDEDTITLFRDVLADLNVLSEAAGEEAVVVLSSQFTRLVMWLKKGTSAGSAKSDGASAAKPICLSVLERTDAAAQGAPLGDASGHVAFVEMCMFMGRVPANSELKGVEHGMSPTMV